jgi:MazG family protein
VARDLELKLIRRHPHIFGDAVAKTPKDVKDRWERIKVEQEGRQGIFHDVPAGFPALLYAKKLQQRAASVGFDWDSASEAFPKIAEEHAELAELFHEAAEGTDPHRADPRVTHEVGDLLFATVNVARLLHVDPEIALRQAGNRFERRVTAAAELAAAAGEDWKALDLQAQEEYYKRAKAGEQPGAPA